jgi:hypothetical protein
MSPRADSDQHRVEAARLADLDTSDELGALGSALGEVYALLRGLAKRGQAAGTADPDVGRALDQLGGDRRGDAPS